MFPAIVTKSEALYSTQRSAKRKTEFFDLDFVL